MWRRPSRWMRRLRSLRPTAVRAARWLAASKSSTAPQWPQLCRSCAAGAPCAQVRSRLRRASARRILQCSNPCAGSVRGSAIDAAIGIDLRGRRGASRFDFGGAHRRQPQCQRQLRGTAPQSFGLRPQLDACTARPACAYSTLTQGGVADWRIRPGVPDDTNPCWPNRRHNAGPIACRWNWPRWVAEV